MKEEFWQRIDLLYHSAKIIIDRPKGSSHPNHPKFIYPMDYGYLEGTKASDRAEIDVWVGSETERRVKAILCTVNIDKNDMETKLLIGCTDEEAHRLLDFMNNAFMSAILIFRDKK